MWLSELLLALGYIDSHSDKTWKCNIEKIEDNVIYWTDGTKDSISDLGLKFVF